MDSARGVIAALALTGCVAMPARAAAQSTTTADPQQRAGQQARPVLDDPANTDVEPLKVRARRLMERLFNPAGGPFVRVGGLPQGSGLAVGPAYRQPFQHLTFTVSAVASVRRYWEVDGKVWLPHLHKDRAFATIGLRRRYLPQEDFFGLGPVTTRDMRTSFTLRETIAYADGGVRPRGPLVIGGTFEYRQPRLDAGKDRRFPSIEELYADPTAPGLAVQPNFVRVGVRAVLDYATDALQSNGDGRYLVAFDRYSDRDFGRYSFNQWTVDLRDVIAIAEGHGLALRGMATGVRPVDGNDVPFYFQPTLGGPNALRGYPSYRFRDRNVVLAQAEYRVVLNKRLTGAVFYDTGDVAPTMRRMDFSDLRQDVGVGLRIRYQSKVVLRVDVAHAFGEGLMFIFKFSDVF